MSHLDQMEIAAISTLPEIDHGAGVTVALLDSGVSRSRALPESRVTCLDHRGREDTTTCGPHGTMCAGLLASEHAIARGVAPKARILSYLVTLADGTPSPSFVRAAITDAIERGADLLSCSFTLAQLRPELEVELRRAIASGVVVVAATDIEGRRHPFPDRIRSTLVVGPATRTGRVPKGVSLNEQVDVLAPGTDLLTVSGNGLRARWREPSSSGPTALVAGVATLLLALAKGPARRRLGRALPDLISATATAMPSSSSPRPGMIRPAAALTAARGLIVRV